MHQLRRDPLPAVSFAQAAALPGLEEPKLEVVTDWVMVRMRVYGIDHETARWLLGVSTRHEVGATRAAAIEAMGTALLSSPDGYHRIAPFRRGIRTRFVRRLLLAMFDRTDSRVRAGAIDGLARARPSVLADVCLLLRLATLAEDEWLRAGVGAALESDEACIRRMRLPTGVLRAAFHVSRRWSRAGRRPCPTCGHECRWFAREEPCPRCRRAGAGGASATA